MAKVNQDLFFISDEKDTVKDSGLCQEWLGAMKEPERVPLP